jgi:hypothetical protein
VETKTKFNILKIMKTTSMEDYLHGRLPPWIPPWKTTSMEDYLHGRLPPWKTTFMEDYLHGRLPPYF